MHKIAKGMRIASCLSCIEIFAVLYYSRLFNLRIEEEKRDRLVISKAHGALSLYPILADFKYIRENELYNISKNGALLGIIPDGTIPGTDVLIGSLGHGLGVGCGLAVALKKKKINSNVIVICGDGELYEGSIWEAIMFAGHHKLNNLLLIIDRNGRCMLDFCKNVIDLEPLDKKFEDFNWYVEKVSNGNNVEELYYSLVKIKNLKNNKPKVIIAYTTKGKGVDILEKDPQAHIKSLTDKEIDVLLQRI